MFKTGIIMIISTFSGSKGGVGKTTLAISIGIVSAIQRIPTLVVDSSSEGGATSYLLGAGAEPPFLSDLDPGSDDITRALRRVPILDEDAGVELVVAVNSSRGVRGLRDVDKLAERIRALNYPVTIIDVPALTDRDAVLRYFPLFEISDTVLVVAEPSTASIRSAMVTFSGKRVVAALNCPRPYTQMVVELYRKYMDVFARRYNIPYVVVPYSRAISLLSSDRLNILSYVEPDFVQAVTELAKLVLSKK
jgi:MinD-like ATPase involved in chromosome partitioning or flagellar assembly